MTRGCILIKDPEREIRLYTFHNGHAVDAACDVLTLPWWLVTAYGDQLVKVHAGTPTRDEINERFAAMPELPRPWYAHTWLSSPERKTLEEFSNDPATLEDRLRRFSYFDSPDAVGISHALVCRHWQRWYPYPAGYCDSGDPVVVVDCLPCGDGVMDWTVSVSVDPECLDGSLFNAITDYCKESEKGPISTVLYDGSDKASINFGAEFCRAMLHCINRMLDVLPK